MMGLSVLAFHLKRVSMGIFAGSKKGERDLYSGWLYSGWLCSGWLCSGWLCSGWLCSGWLCSGWLCSGWLCSGWLYSGWCFLNGLASDGLVLLVLVWVVWEMNRTAIGAREPSFLHPTCRHICSSEL